LAKSAFAVCLCVVVVIVIIIIIIIIVVVVVDAFKDLGLVAHSGLSITI
jgi:hypothetical protein